jgi:hypothetical protein
MTNLFIHGRFLVVEIWSGFNISWASHRQTNMGKAEKGPP